MLQVQTTVPDLILKKNKSHETCQKKVNYESTMKTLNKLFPQKNTKQTKMNLDIAWKFNWAQFGSKVNFLGGLIFFSKLKSRKPKCFCLICT